MTETYETILATFQKAGYRIKTEICSARGLTSTTRKRLFFVGIRNDIDTPPFQFPFVPDLKIRAQDILDYDTLSDEEMDILRLSETTFAQLLQNRRWRPAHMAWPNRVCDTITSHYGNSVGRGESQLVPCHAPHRPRRFSIRECARLMGFPSYYKVRTFQIFENFHIFNFLQAFSFRAPLVLTTGRESRRYGLQER